jgi:ABC-2 type transport system ATP-binding protein
MRRRIDIAASIVVTPELIFLDEPTTGLDPRSRNQVWDIVRAMVQAGTTVLLTTQYLDEADQLADRISVIDAGKVIAEGTPGQLKASVGASALHVRLLNPDDRPRARAVLEQALGSTVTEDADPSALTAAVESSAPAMRGIAALERTDVPIAQFSLGQPSLDEVFLALTGRPATEADDPDDAPTEGAA